MIWLKKQRYDWTYYLDVFNDEITGSNVKPFLHCSNPIIESKNGCLKKEMCLDFIQDDYETFDEYINAIIEEHNSYRPSYALQYKIPIECRIQLGFKYILFNCLIFID